MATSQEARIDYHLRELEIARDPASPDHVMPVFTGEERVILDLGCGIGQTLVVAAGGDRSKVLVGLDPDAAALEYGRKRFSHVHFVNGTAEALPFPAGSFDMVISRVALPYTHIGTTLREVARVMRPAGRLWVTLHSFGMALNYLKNAIFDFKPKRAVLGSYVIANGALLHFLGRQFRFPVDRRYESFQTEAGMRRAARAAGFGNISIRRNRHFLLTAQMPA
jgi:ubiquinone/menaquinone biosynthesis C-methylase UbiE